MSASTREMPWMVRCSVWLYSHLLIAYPQPFRREYGVHMVQVFRDCCREATATYGSVGLIRYWLIALGDLIVSALAEHRREELHMTRMHWIRLGSLAAIIGSIIPALMYALYLTPSFIQLLAPNVSLYPEIPIEVIWVSVVQWMLYVLALVALWLCGASRAGGFVWTGIAFALVGTIITGGGYVLVRSALLYDYSQMYASTNVIHIGSVILAIGMLLYGVTTLKNHLLPRLNWLPLVVGLTGLLDVVALSIGALIFPQGSDAYMLKFSILVNATGLVATMAWMLLGIALWPRRSEQAVVRDVPASVEPAI